jgi:UPF0716 family protein affecting phage T7 exclusion
VLDTLILMIVSAVFGFAVGRVKSLAAFSKRCRRNSKL